MKTTNNTVNNIDNRNIDNRQQYSTIVQNNIVLYEAPAREESHTGARMDVRMAELHGSYVIAFITIGIFAISTMQFGWDWAQLAPLSLIPAALIAHHVRWSCVSISAKVHMLWITIILPAVLVWVFVPHVSSVRAVLMIGELTIFFIVVALAVIPATIEDASRRNRP